MADVTVTQSFLDSLNERATKAERKAEDLGLALKQARIKGRKASREPPPTAPDPERPKPVLDSDLSRQLTEANAKLAAIDHRNTFRQAALAKGVKAEFADKLYKVLDLAPGDAQAKPEDFHAALDAAKEADSWAFSSSPEPPKGPGTPPTAPPPGSGRGASSPPANRVEYTDDEVARPGWQQARPDLVEAFAKGNAVRAGG